MTKSEILYTILFIGCSRHSVYWLRSLIVYRRTIPDTIRLGKSGNAWQRISIVGASGSRKKRIAELFAQADDNRVVTPPAPGSVINAVPLTMTVVRSAA
jgi:hypothetical protein